MKKLTALIICLLAFIGCDYEASDKPEAIITNPNYISAEEAAYFNELEKQAERGSRSAEFKLVYYRDWMKGQYDEAMPVLKRLANEGSMEAAEILAVAYHDGKGVEKDLDKALYWLGKAKALGSEKAETKLKAYQEYRDSQS